MTPAPEYFDDIHIHRRTGARMLTSIGPDDEITTALGEAWYSVGIHPWDTAEAPDELTWSRLEALAADPRVAAIGECGLDALRGGDAELQEKIFLRQAELAERTGKFMVIHCVRRYGRLMELRKAFKPRQRWIIHGFRGKPELARQLIAAGFELSLRRGTGEALRSALPGCHFFSETDVPSEE